MVTASVLTLYLAQAIGLYVLLVGLSGLARPQRWAALIDDLATSPALQFIAGVLVFAIGVALILAHSHVTDALAIIVTLVGWLALLEGALLIAVPDPLIRLGRLAVRYTRIWAILCIVIGLLLGLAGVTGQAGAVAPVYI